MGSVRRSHTNLGDVRSVVTWKLLKHLAPIGSHHQFVMAFVVQPCQCVNLPE